MDLRFAGWRDWPNLKKKTAVFAAEAHEVRLEGLGHTVLRKLPNGDGADWNKGGIDMVSIGPDGKWYLHEVKGTTGGGLSFSDDLKVQLNTRERALYEREWIAASLKRYQAQGVLTEPDVEAILHALDHPDTNKIVRSLTVYGDEPLLPSAALVASKDGVNLDLIETLPLAGYLEGTIT
jgi:hypothetical protein